MRFKALASKRPRTGKVWLNKIRIRRVSSYKLRLVRFLVRIRIVLHRAKNVRVPTSMIITKHRRIYDHKREF